MGEELRFPIVVRDDGTVVVNRFARSLTRSADVARRAGGRITKAFRSVGKGLRRLPGAIFSIRGALVALGGAVVIRAFTNVISAAATQEDAINRLNAALRTAGMFSGEVSESAQRLASSLQAQTRFGDEAILSMQALLITYGVTTDKLEEATRASLDFAAATGKDVTTAALTVGKAAAGFTGELSRYGIIVDTKSIPASEVFTTVLAKLNEQFGGRAQADVLSISGRFVQLGNLIGDVREKIGFAITKSQDFRAALADLTVGLVAVNEALKGTGTGLGASVAAFVPSADTLVSSLFNLTSAGIRLRIVFIGIGLATNFLGIGVVAIIVLLERLRNFLVTELAAAFTILLETFTEVTEQILDRLSRTLLNIGIVLIGIGGPTTSLGKKLLNLSATIGKAATSADDFGDNLRTQELRSGAAEKRVAFLNGVLRMMRADIRAGTQAMGEQIDALERLNETFEKAKAQVRALRIEQKTAAEAARTAAAVARAVAQQQGVVTIEIQFGVQEALGELSAVNRARLAEDVKFQEATEIQKLDIIDKALAKERALRKLQASTAISGTASLFGALANLAESGGEKSFKIAQRFRIAEAIISGIQAVQAALASPPGPPFTIPLAAAIAVQTAANVAAIRSARPGGGGAAVGAAGGGPGAPPTAAPAPVELAEAPGRPSIINITVDGFVGDQAELASRLIEILREVQGDGGQLEVIT